MSYKSFKTLGNYQIRKTIDPNPTGYDIINTDSQLLYYSFNSGTVSGTSVSNYTTGGPVQDASLLNNTQIQNNKLYIPSTTEFDGLAINRAINTVGNSVLSISMWLNFSIETVGGAYLFITGLFTNSASSSSGTRWFVRISPFNGNLEVGTDANLQTTSFKPAINQWYHVVIRLTSSNAGNMWVNGSFNQSIDGAGYPNFVNDAGANCIARNPTNRGRGLVGYMDEYRHYSRYIQNDEIIALYNYGHS